MDSENLKGDILTGALQLAPTHGWSMDTVRMAAQAKGQEELMADALFAGGIRGVTRAISPYFDALTLKHLGIANDNMRVRDKIGHAVMMRLDLMAPYKDGLRIAFGRRGVRALWRSADSIWVWAGDNSTDYNHYTKRALLSAVIASTTLFWFQDSSPGHRATHSFLERRIGNVLGVGKAIGMFKSFFKKRAG